jgi:hypothetical protein
MVLDMSDLVAEIRKASKDIEIAAILAIARDRGMAAEQHRICEIVRRQATNPTTLLRAIRQPQR